MIQPHRCGQEGFQRNCPCGGIRTTSGRSRNCRNGNAQARKAGTSAQEKPFPNRFLMEFFPFPVNKAMYHVSILGLGLIAFVFDTVGGVLFAKIMNLFVKNKVNPMIGAAGISAFPMSARIIQKMGQQEDPQNFLLMHAVGANVSGQIASVIAGGIILNMIH